MKQKDDSVLGRTRLEPPMREPESPRRDSAKAVFEHLTQYLELQMKPRSAADMGGLGANVYSGRIAHFNDEKQELGKRLAHFVIRRSFGFMKKGRKVVLLCDSGTSVFWFLAALGEAINKHCRSNKKRVLKPKDLVIVTNNIPGAESFICYASSHNVPQPSGESSISDLVDCRILAGTFLPEYGAHAGRDTELDLENYAKQIKGGKLDERRRNPGPAFLAFTTGNWITIKGPDGSALPYYLIRGNRHRAFKEKLLQVSDEIFAIAPLGKILPEVSVTDLNQYLHYSLDKDNPRQEGYEEIPTPANKAGVTRIVSTIREKQSVLRDHSAHLCKKLGQYIVLDPSNKKARGQACGFIAEKTHLLFAFDKFCNETVQTQLEIEFPHQLTRNDRFKREFFSIQS